MTHKQNMIWTFIITSVALFMVTLDNLVVTTALPVIRVDLHSGLSGLAVALGPLVGGAVVSGVSWHWIFWLNVPIGVVLAPLGLRRLRETYGPATRLDLPGLGLASAGLFGIVWGLVRGNSVGWGTAEIVGALVAGALVLVAFVAWSCGRSIRCSRCASSATPPSRSQTSPRC